MIPENRTFRKLGALPDGPVCLRWQLCLGRSPDFGKSHFRTRKCDFHISPMFHQGLSASGSRKVPLATLLVTGISRLPGWPIPFIIPIRNQLFWISVRLHGIAFGLCFTSRDSSWPLLGTSWEPLILRNLISTSNSQLK